MKKQLSICLFGLCFLFACSSECKDEKCKDEKCTKSDNAQKAPVQEGTIAKNSDQEISCKLTSAELQKRKETVLESLKKQILAKKELANGYSFKFQGTDAVIDELTEFVKSERSCCNFFVFTLSFSGDGTEAWLSLTGPEGAKDMISDELGL
jgi:hypothetical protein